ncbi:MAG: hypothetical protein DMG10_25810 [Acidobacteria bacterium]|nr:MAG: hypothetical protein DMG10_25810 [Acidobacteriota bacterium]
MSSRGKPQRTKYTARIFRSPKGNSVFNGATSAWSGIPSENSSIERRCRSARRAGGLDRADMAPGEGELQPPSDHRGACF